MKDCNQCGKCCIKYSDGGLSATQDEIDWWEIFRPNIARYVSNGDIWVDPETGQALTRCPWLQSTNASNKTIYSCQIYHDRPDDCRHYPTHIDEMIRDECEMLEPKDLQHPKQAQRSLDIIMVDSRPAYSASDDFAK